jgi:hypothetical protein
MIARRRTDRRMWPAALAVALLIALMPGQSAAAIRFDLHLGAPPVLVPIPASSVRYAPSLHANYFFYAGRYFVFDDDLWYTAATYDGPWLVIAPEAVPVPILAVPITYYRVLPPPWVHWRRDRPPRWDSAYHQFRDQRHEDGARAFPDAGHRGHEHGRRG